jgi:hypothetical protein
VDEDIVDTYSVADRVVGKESAYIVEHANKAEKILET